MASFEKFLRIVHIAGADKELDTGGPYTVFVPDDIYMDHSLNIMTPGEAIVFLRDHIATGEYVVQDLPKGYKIITLADESYDFDNNGGASIHGANIIKKDITCTNGFIQVIDRAFL